MWWYLLLSIGLLSFGAYSLLLVHRKLGPKPGANVKYDAWLASSAVLFKIVGWGEIILVRWRCSFSSRPDWSRGLDVPDFKPVHFHDLRWLEELVQFDCDQVNRDLYLAVSWASTSPLANWMHTTSQAKLAIPTKSA